MIPNDQLPTMVLVGLQPLSNLELHCGAFLPPPGLSHPLSNLLLSCLGSQVKVDIFYVNIKFIQVFIDIKFY
jgi:hypothetical protein